MKAGRLLRNAIALAAVVCCSCSQSGPQENGNTYQGTGGTFPAPIYDRWFDEFNDLRPEVLVSYQALGSGAGIEQFMNQMVNFGGSDAPMSDEQMAKVPRGVQLLPVTAGNVSLAYNVPGVGEGLKLSREVYAGIYNGGVTHWNDERIEKDNPDVELPDLRIIPVYRADDSGTTYAFSNHLSAVDPQWAKEVGRGLSVDWPVVGIGGRGNGEVAGLIQRNTGAIGYVESSYAKLAGMPRAHVQNAAGNFVPPTVENGKAALQEVKITPELRIEVPDPQGQNSYPIVTFTWLLLYEEYEELQEAVHLKALIRYCMTDGQQHAEPLGYIPIPEHVATAVLEAVETIGQSKTEKSPDSTKDKADAAAPPAKKAPSKKADAKQPASK
ncbi:Phosphate-binding protein PstS precursor [Planctomycetes bacterium Pan216]|uniref:Phosphate-binding protein n=1 Tax=Kolteria novifilia TaxID=2527975 RepID=A0A518B525_9BACT|nr:Phosphate-binding protein PstS precursor [Planctomycetes bacterium Pan216]